MKITIYSNTLTDDELRAVFSDCPVSQWEKNEPEKHHRSMDPIVVAVTAVIQTSAKILIELLVSFVESKRKSAQQESCFVTILLKSGRIIKLKAVGDPKHISDVMDEDEIDMIRIGESS